MILYLHLLLAKRLPSTHTINKDVDMVWRDLARNPKGLWMW